MPDIEYDSDGIPYIDESVDEGTPVSLSPVSLTPADLVPFASIDPVKAQAMIDDAMALAARIAPCIMLADFQFSAAARAILRAAVLRWNEAGVAASTSQQAGPFGVGTTSARKSMFWPSEITDLQGLCSSGGGAGGGAFSINTLPTKSFNHSDICALVFGALYCSCGANLTLSDPLWEV
jgi:hypothetical protein